jgi:hypothetical protein
MSMWFSPAGLHTVPADASTAAALLAEIVALGTFSTMTTELRTFMHSSDSFTQVAMYTYPSGGNHSAAAVNSPLALAGSGATRLLPNQCAVVVSLRSPFAGRQNRGRFYVPMTAGGLTQANTSQLTSAKCTSLCNAVKGFLSDMNVHGFANLSGDSLRPCVSSRGQSALILTVVVDSVIDTQRRRRNKVLPAASASATV